MQGYNSSAEHEYSAAMGFGDTRCVSMGPNSMNFCTDNGLYGIHVDGRSLASILALVLFVYTLLMGVLVVAGFWVYGKFFKSKQSKENVHSSLTSSLFDNDSL